MQTLPMPPLMKSVKSALSNDVEVVEWKEVDGDGRQQITVENIENPDINYLHCSIATAKKLGALLLHIADPSIPLPITKKEAAELGSILANL